MRTGDVLVLHEEEDPDGWTGVEPVPRVACLVILSPPFQPTLATDPRGVYCLYLDPLTGPRCDALAALWRPGQLWERRAVSAERLATPAALCRAWSACREDPPGCAGLCGGGGPRQDLDAPGFLSQFLCELGVLDRGWRWADILAERPLLGRGVTWELSQELAEAGPGENP